MGNILLMDMVVAMGSGKRWNSARKHAKSVCDVDGDRASTSETCYHAVVVWFGCGTAVAFVLLCVCVFVCDDCRVIAEGHCHCCVCDD